MNRKALSVGLVVAAVLSTAVAAQSGSAMAKGDKMKMNDKKKNITYTGCIETGPAAGSFTLTHVTVADHMAKDMMKDDMKHDTMAADDMKHDAMPADTMSREAMTPSTLRLTGKAVRLSNVGQKVSVTGSLAPTMGAMGNGTMSGSLSSFAVKSLKVVAASCS